MYTFLALFRGHIRTTAALLCFVMVFGGCSASCPKGWTTYNDNCYKVNDIPSGNSFDRHLASCRRQGGSLVSIHSDDQQRFVESLVQSDSPRPVWIGLYDTFKNGTWKWTDGTPLDYKNWGPSQPNNEDGAQFCVLMQKEEEPKWDDEDCCSKEAVGICQKPIAGLHQCPENWTYLPSTLSCYKVEKTDDSFNFTQAHTACTSVGGDLASIHSLQEQTLAFSLVIGQSSSKWAHSIAWFGLVRATFSSPWQWTDGSPTDFKHWSKGAPNKKGGCAGFLVSSSTGFWCDVECTDDSPGLNSAICKRKAVIGPSTTTKPTETNEEADKEVDLVNPNNANMCRKDEELEETTEQATRRN